MSFLQPEVLGLLLAWPLLPAVYVWLLRRRLRGVVRVSSLQVARRALGNPWRRHVPPALLLLAITVLMIALFGREK